MECSQNVPRSLCQFGDATVDKINTLPALRNLRVCWERQKSTGTYNLVWWAPWWVSPGRLCEKRQIEVGDRRACWELYSQNFPFWVGKKFVQYFYSTYHWGEIQSGMIFNGSLLLAEFVRLAVQGTHIVVLGILPLSPHQFVNSVGSNVKKKYKGGPFQFIQYAKIWIYKLDMLKWNTQYISKLVFLMHSTYWVLISPSNLSSRELLFTLQNNSSFSQRYHKVSLIITLFDS